MRSAFLQNLNTANVSDSQVDNVRRMLLAMVEDVRAVVIKLAERIACPRSKNATEETRVMVAKRSPTSTRHWRIDFGIGQLKWN